MQTVKLYNRPTRRNRIQN